MSEDKTDHCEERQRRKRINLYKRIIIIVIVAIILLPTLLCIILFCRLNSLQKDFSELRAYIEASERTAQAGTSSKGTGQGAGLNMENDGRVPVKDNDTADSTTDETPQESADVNVSDTENTHETESVTDDNETSGNTQQLIEQAVEQGRKVVYLTFDDGPGDNTENLLDVLDEYDVKATFFVNGHQGYETALNRIVMEGHTLALHTYTHEYESVYGSVASFAEEIITLQDYLTDVTGFRPYIFRFPGGSSNSGTPLPITEYIDYLNENNLIYFDWNVSSGDGGGDLSAQQVHDNVLNGVASNDISVVLMHDAAYRMTTFEAVPMIIESLQDMDALILPITADTKPVHHHIN